MSSPSRHGPCLVFAVASALLLMVPAVAGPSRAEIGAGSNLHVSTRTQMLFQQGGGYITWEISGPVAKDIRRNIDGAFGDGDGDVTETEGTAYTGEIDSILENNVFYGCARIMRSALLTKVLHTSSDGLLGQVNQTGPIIIRFYFNADLRPDRSTVSLGDTTVPMAVFRALRGDGNRTFAGTLEWDHQEIMVGFSSFSQVEMDKGSITRLRAPGAEIFWFHLTISGNETSQDRTRFETFDAAQSPLELFVVLCVFGLVGLWFPRRYLKISRMRKVSWLHLAMWLMAIGVLLVFFLGVDGLAVWTLAPLFLVASWVLSWGIYIKRWKGIAKPLMPPRLAQGPPPDPLSREARELEADKIWEGEVQKELDGQGGRAAAPAAAMKSEAPQAFPEPERTATKTLRCPKCKATFEIKDPGTRPLPIKCTACGTEGVLRK
jgi:hypothetical protein